MLGRALPPAYHASFLDARVSLGTLSPLRSHSNSAQWPRGILQAIPPPPLIQWENVPLAPRSPPFNLDKASSDDHHLLRLCRSIFYQRRVATGALRLCHPFYIFTTQGGGWPSPILSLLIFTDHIKPWHGSAVILADHLMLSPRPLRLH